MPDACIDVNAVVYLSPAQVSAIIADHFARHGLTVGSVVYVVGPTRTGVVISGGDAVGCTGVAVRIDPACMTGPRVVPIPATTARTNCDDADTPTTTEETRP